MEADPKSQRVALKKLLGSKYGVVNTEVKFDWLIVPDTASISAELKVITEALSKYRGFKSFFTPGKLLSCDFYVPSGKLIIEYDERQHFTIPRAISIKSYPLNLEPGFDKEKWIISCEKIQAKDPTPPHRDEQRAFYDSMRDILAPRHGLALIRIKHGDFDWQSKNAQKQLTEILLGHSRIESIIPL